MSLYDQCATCGKQLILGEGVFCGAACRQMYHESHVVPLIREQERLDADHMDDMSMYDEAESFYPEPPEEPTQ